MLSNRANLIGLQIELKPKGRKKEALNPAFVQIVVEDWKEHKIGSHKMWRRLKKQGIRRVAKKNSGNLQPAGEKGLFTQWCEKQGIKHALGRVHHPQTNGKIERWFGTYKQEYDERFSCLKDFIKHCNEERIHQGIGYLTPQEKWQKC